MNEPEAQLSNSRLPATDAAIDQANQISLLFWFGLVRSGPYVFAEPDSPANMGLDRNGQSERANQAAKNIRRSLF